ncbi:hypothetical protein ABZ477_17435 [Microbacterium sp. NPDC019599]|uniref:hypothetical protein n=1 Tax=Microbacterium sp. NPDC019599 TaxID=3154690 RepID=UPI003402D0C4
MHELAIALAVIGILCLAAHRRRARLLELSASLVMVPAMLDSGATAPVLPPILWTGILIATAGALGVAHRARRGPAHADHEPVAVPHSPVYTALGLVVMAALVAGVPHLEGTASGHHGHGGGSLVALLVLVPTAYLIGSIAGALRMRHPLDRVHLAAMGVSAGLMGIAALS